jgi:ABC-2 type transport system ATP-binding protein
MPAPAVRIQGVTKRFGAHTAVRDLDLEIPTGAIYGFIGPNGSGKSTTMRMIANILVPDEGSLEVLGEHPSRRQLGALGYLPEERGLHRGMKVKDLLTFHAALRGGESQRGEIDGWLERLGLAPFAHQKLETLSKGMSQKVQFLATIVPAPRLLMLDEPFTGLDPVSAEQLRAAVLELRQRGATVILSTHDMNTAETLCDGLFMIYRSRKVLDGAVDAIQSQHGGNLIRVATARGLAALDGLPGVEEVRDLGRLQELRLAPGADPQQVLRWLLARTAVTHFELAKPSLQEIFVRIARPALEAAPLAA